MRPDALLRRRHTIRLYRVEAELVSFELRVQYFINKVHKSSDVATKSTKTVTVSDMGSPELSCKRAVLELLFLLLPLALMIMTTMTQLLLMEIISGV